MTGQVTTSRWLCGVSHSSSQVTTAASSAGTAAGPPSPTVSPPSARSSPTPPGTGWWWPPTSSTAWSESSRWNKTIATPFLQLMDFITLFLSVEEKHFAFRVYNSWQTSYVLLLIISRIQINCLLSVASVVTATCWRGTTRPSATTATGQASLPGARKVRRAIVLSSLSQTRLTSSLLSISRLCGERKDSADRKHGTVRISVTTILLWCDSVSSSGCQSCLSY